MVLNHPLVWDVELLNPLPLSLGFSYYFFLLILSGSSDEEPHEMEGRGGRKMASSLPQILSFLSQQNKP